MITEVATVTETILIYFFFVTKTMKRLVPKVLENTYHVYSYKVQFIQYYRSNCYKVQLVYNYTT